jgi:hypothetical protein
MLLAEQKQSLGCQSEFVRQLRQPTEGVPGGNAGALTRTTHEDSTAAVDPGMSVALRLVGFLDVPQFILNIPSPESGFYDSSTSRILRAKPSIENGF